MLNKYWRELRKIKLSPLGKRYYRFTLRSIQSNFPLFLAVIFLSPALIILFFFLNSQLFNTQSYAANFTGKVKVSKQSTTFGTNGNWYTAMAYSGDGLNGDAEVGTFNPIHPGGTTDGSAGALAVGYLALGANATYAAAPFVGFQASSSANLAGVQVILENSTATSLSNVDIVVELLRFPSASCTTSCSNYVTGSLGAFTYPTDTQVLRRTVWQFNQGLSGENVQPGNFGRATYDFRFDTPVAITAGNHYGIRIINMGASAPVFGTWAQAPQANGFPTVNGTIRTIGVADIDNSTATTWTMPLVLSGNNVLTTSPMVAVNSSPGVGLASVRRTENEHWVATYSASTTSWTLRGSASGIQSRTLTTATDGSSGASWVNDGVPVTTLVADATASTRLCVNSISGFAAGQTIDIWDSNTAAAPFTIASVNASDGNCTGSSPSIITTAALTANANNYTTSKNATVALASWKQRIVQGAIVAFSENMPTTTKICVPSGWATKFAANTAGTGNNIAVWDDDTAIAVNRVTAVSAADGACVSGHSLTISSAITGGTVTIDKNATVAEISANISNSGTPNNGDIMRWTTFNSPQNPTGSSLQARTTSVMLAYAKNEAPATSGARYPYLSNRHIYFVAYGDSDTTAPADGDIVIVGNAKSDPDSLDSTALTTDFNWSSKEPHIVNIDKSWEGALAYTGSNGGAVLDGAGARTDYSAYSQNGGWVSAVVAPGSQLGIANTANSHYRVTFPGKIVVDSDASLAFGKAGSEIPSSSMHDVYFDTTSPAVTTTLTADSAATTALTVTSTTGLYPGDTIVIDDNDSVAITRVIASVNSTTSLTLTAAAVTGYTTAQSAFISKGPLTEIPTGQDRRSGVFTMTGLVTTTQTNTRTGRVNLYASGSAQLRTSKSDLAVDIDGNVDTGYLGNNFTDTGNTWVDVKDDVVGNWQPLDQIAVGGGTNQAVDNNISSVGMGANDDANQMPVWTGGTTAGGRNALPTPNTEIAEIGTIPLTDIFNANYNGGSVVFSQANYATSAAWTVFGDNANSEVGDAVYFGDRGSNMFYSLELSLGQALNAAVNIVWEYYKSGVGWTAFTPRDAYYYQPRAGLTLPLSADITRGSYTASLAAGGTNFGLDQIVMIDDNDSPPIYVRLATSAPTATVLTFADPLPAGYTTAQGATVTRLNGGQWRSIDPTSIFGTSGRRLLSWTPANLNGTPAKTTVNGINAYWVRARISTFTSWTTSPTIATTPVGMSGVERLSSSAISVSSGVQEAKISEVTPGASYDPNEQWVLEYGNSPGWVEAQKYATTTQLPPSAPYAWGIKNGTLNINENNLRNLLITNTRNGGLGLTDYTVSTLIYMDQAADATARLMGVTLRQGLDSNGYAALISKTNAANTIQWYTTLAGVPTAIGSGTSKAFSADTWYCIKAQVSGTTLNAKFWATTDCNSNEPGSWDVTTTNATYTAGRFGVFAGSGTNSTGVKLIVDNYAVSNGFADTFTDTQTWRVEGSINGYQGVATPSSQFASNFINFTLKHKGGWNGVVPPEIGDRIYLSSTAIRSYKGLATDVGITTSNASTKYETWDFEWNPTGQNYTATGSATGNGTYATPGSTYTAPGSALSLKIPSGAPTGTKFGNKMLLLQSNLRRNTGSWTGANGQGSAVLIYPTLTVTGSTLATRYNIEGQANTATARQRGTIDFWFKTNYTGAPSSSFYPHGMYLVDYANAGDTDRLFVRHNPDGTLEAAVYAGATQGTLLRQSFSATAGQWYHFRLGWDETANAKRAWLDGVPFSTGQASTVGTRGANAGILRIGNRWTYDAPFDGSIDELAIFDDDIDTSASCNYGAFTPPTTTWTGGATIACNGTDTGVNLFRASFDPAMNRQEGFVWADYAYGNPSMVFTNGADTGNDRIRVITYPQRTRIWVDNTGEKYTPSARIKSGSGYQENATLATLTGWSHNFTYHHKAARQSTTSPTYSPVLNLRRSTHIWSDEEINSTGATLGAPVRAGLGFGTVGVGLSGLGTMEFSDVSMENQYANMAITTNPFTGLISKPSQRIANSVFYNFYDRAYTVANKTQGTNLVGAYFVTTNFAAANIGSGYNASLSQNVGIDGSIFMGNRNAYVTVPPVAANGAASFFSGRLYTVNNSEFYNNGITGMGTSGALNFSSGVAKVNITNNKFSINTNGIRLYGNAFFNLENNSFDGHVSDNVTVQAGEYGAGIRVAPTSSTVGITDSGSTFGRGLWNETDISLPPNTASFESESLLQFLGENTQILSPTLFGTADYLNMTRLADSYMGVTIPGTDIRGTHSSNQKDIVNVGTYGNMRTTGLGLPDTTLRTSGGYGWRMDPTSSDISLDYTANVVGVSGKPLAVTGYLRLDSNFGTTNLPTVTLSGLGMTGSTLSWTASSTQNTWQQFTVYGTPTESALAEVKVSAKLDKVVSDSGTNEVITQPLGNYLPLMVEDVDKSWTPNQWVGYKFQDSNGKLFDIIRNTDKLLFLKGIVDPYLLSTTFTAATTGDYVIFAQPHVYIDDVSVLSGTVDTGSLDFFSSGQPVSPWLSTGLTAESIWNAQSSVFANSDGSFGQLLNDALVAKYAEVSDISPSTTEFDTTLTAGTDDYYNNGVVIFTAGSNIGVVRRISDYNGLNKTVTIDSALPFAPSNGDRFAILAATASSTGGGGGGATAADIWSYAVRQLTTSSLGDGGSIATAGGLNALSSQIGALNNISASDVWAYGTRTITGEVNLSAGSSQAIWDNACAVLNTSGSVGKRICDNLDTNVSSRSTLSASDVWNSATRTITNLENPALSALANSVWANATRTLTSYGNNLSAADVWNTLTSSISTIDSIGKLLVTNVDTTIGSRATQTSVNTLAGNLATTSALVDTTISSRATQASLDAHEAADATFRTNTTNTLGALTVNVGTVLTQLSAIDDKIDNISDLLNSMDDKIDTIDSDLASVSGTVADTNTKVSAMQTVTNNILTKWGSYSASELIGYVDSLESSLGTSVDASTSGTVFGRIKEVNALIGQGGGVSLGDSDSDNIATILTTATGIANSLASLEAALDYEGKSTTTYSDMMDIKSDLATLQTDISNLTSSTSSLASTLSTVSSDLEDITDNIGMVNTDSLSSLFEVKKTDIVYLTNKVIELQAVSDINRQLLEQTVNEPVVKVVMEWGSVIIKFVVVNPSNSSPQKIPFKAFLPKEVKQEYIMDLGGLELNYDAATEQYYVTADLALKPGESVIRAVEIKDIWIISADEIASLRKQADELSTGLDDTSYFAQGLTLKTDINTRLDRIERKQKDSNATPQDHILAYRENTEDIKAINENISGLKSLVLSSSTSSNLLASVGGIQTFATWGIVVVLVFGMGALGSFYYSLWRKRNGLVTQTKEGKTKKLSSLALKVPMPWQVIPFKEILASLVSKIHSVSETLGNIPRKAWLLMGASIVVLIIVSTVGVVALNYFKHKQPEKPHKPVVASENEDGLSAAVKEEVANLEKDAKNKEILRNEVEELVAKVNSSTDSAQVAPVASPAADQAVLGLQTGTYRNLIVKQTPTGWLNVRTDPKISSEVKTKIYPGDTYPFSELVAGWYKILLKDLTWGWISSEYVELEETLSQSSYVLITPPDGANVNVREQPTTQSKIIKSVFSESRVPKVGEEGNWVAIKLGDGKKGWISKEFIQAE